MKRLFSYITQATDGQWLLQQQQQLNDYDDLKTQCSELVSRSVHARLQFGAVVMIWALLVHTHTHRQLLTSYPISSASWAKNVQNKHYL